MNWQGISEFVYVAEAESFTMAAKKLTISTAQVSRQITALEQRLKVKLLYRTTRKVSLTQEGSLFYQHCRAVLDGLEQAETAITNLQATPQGTIKLTASVTFGEQQILPLINNFVLKHPDIEVVAQLTNQKIDLVDEGYDLAIRLGSLKDSSLMAKKLAERTNFVCAAPSYLEKHSTPHTLSELNKHNCLLGTRDYWRFSEGEKSKNIRVSGSVRFNSGYGLVDAALKGLGIVQLPDYYVKDSIDQGKLITLLDHYREPDEGIWAVYPHNKQLSPKIRILVDYLVEQLG